MERWAAGWRGTGAARCLRAARRACGLAPVLVGAVALLTACGQRAEPERYSVRLQPVNDSGVSGTAQLEQTGEHFEIEIHATGMVPDRIHAQGLRAFGRGDRNSRCPTAATDAAEGRSAYGGSLLPLEPYPTVDSDGDLDYQLTFTLDPKNVDRLRGGALLLQGEDSGGLYDHTVPVACGRIVSGRPVEAADRSTGPVPQTAVVTP